MPGRLVSALVLGLLMPSIGWAERLPTRTFTAADGLAHNVVTRIVRDSHGYQWFCTREGLSRFDGGRFVSYGMEAGLPSAEVNDLLETRGGTYWIATGAGLVRFDPMGLPRQDAQRPMFSVLKPAQAAAPLVVSAMLEDRAGHLWIGTLAGLYRLNVPEGGNPALEPVDLGLVAEVLSLAADTSGSLWVGSNIGLFRVSGDLRAQRYTTRQGLPGQFVSALLTDHQGRLWVGTRDGGFAVLAPPGDDEKVTLLRTVLAADAAGTWINEFLETSDDQVWIATNAGLARVRPQAIDDHASPSTELVPLGMTAGALSLAEDRNHNLWIGTATGATRVLMTGFSLFSTADGIPAASSLIETPAGIVLAMTAGTTRAGASWFDGRRFVPLQLPIDPADTSWGWNQLLLAGRDGEWWIGARSGALRLRGVNDVTRLQHAPIQRFSTRDGLTANVVLRLFEDSHGDVWIGTVGEGKANGLSRWERSTGMLHHYGSDRRLPDLERYFVTAFAEDRAGGLWIGFSDGGGLARLRGGTIERVVAQDAPAMGAVRNLLVSSTGALWAAMSRAGLWRVDNPTIDHPSASTITAADGLSSNDVGAVVEDRAGRIYAGTARGIDRIELASGAGRITRYGPAEGIPVGEVYAAMRDRAGTLWFGVKSGIVRFTPTADRRRPLPGVVIDGLTVNDRPQHVSALGEADLERFELPPGRTSLQVSYLAPGLAPMDRVRYQIRLEGVDQEWSAPSDQRTVSYANIGPGHYRFAVRALTSDGTLSGNVAGFEFRVLTPVWRRWWFLSTAAVLGWVVAYTLYRFRIARVLRVAEIRAGIARDLHDDVGANLTRIAVLAEVVRRRGAVAAAADTSLSSIATVARESMTAMDEIVWAVDPDRDRVGDLARRMREYAEEMFDSSEVSLTFAVPESLKDLRLAVNVRRDLYLIFKEATNNAARHSGCSCFKIEVRRHRRSLSIAMVDDGRGFEVRDTDGHGLSNMRRRSALLGGELTVRSEPGRGTAVILAVPIGAHARLFG